jgi:hypothetical protein
LPEKENEMGNGQRLNQKLNVILHGTFAYIDSDEHFMDALIPLPNFDDGVDHVFRAGNWLGETELRPGTYRLEGVKEGKDYLDHTKNLIFQNGRTRAQRDPQTQYARIIFPRPERITSLRLAKVDLKSPPADLTGNHGAALQVFTYDVDSDPMLRLQKISDDEKNELPGHYWEPVFTSDYAGLQIFSAEDHPDDPAHTSRAYQKVAALLGVTNIELNQVHRAHGIDDKDLPPGVIADETEDLAARTLRLARLGRLRRRSADLAQAWFGNEALDGNPDACLCQGCQVSTVHH